MTESGIPLCVAESVIAVAGQGRQVHHVGPFRACLDPSSDLAWLNYVVPVWALGTPEETREQLRRLEAIFRGQGRRLRFEFVDGIWHGLPAALEEYGLRLDGDMPLMACTAATFQPRRSEAVTVEPVEAQDRESVRRFLEVQHEAFRGMLPELTEAEINQTQHQFAERFWTGAVARWRGIPAAAAILVPSGSVCELAGVGTRPGFRRRGIAATLSSYLINSHFAAGGQLVWLSAGDTVAQRTYEAIGFRLFGRQLNYSLPRESGTGDAARADEGCNPEEEHRGAEEGRQQNAEQTAVPTVAVLKLAPGTDRRRDRNNP